MERKDFLKKGISGLAGIVAIPTLISSCSNDDNPIPNLADCGTDGCKVMCNDDLGPFPNKTPTDLVRDNIIGDRSGVALMIKLIVQNTNNNCSPLQGATIDIWHCDARGNYSEYDGQLDGSFTTKSFLRGRQTTDSNGNASFISVFPGWYPGRAPHIHVEIKNQTGSSLLITQIYFQENVYNTVYASSGYKGQPDTSNSDEGSLATKNMADSITGNLTDGYTLTRTIKVAG